jgi:hypothetical protein
MTTMTFLGKYLKGVIEREKAAIGVLITLREPTKPMLTEAAAAGFYESKELPGHYPRLRILTIGGCRRHRFLMSASGGIVEAHFVVPRWAGTRPAPTSAPRGWGFAGPARSADRRLGKPRYVRATGD